MEFYRSDSKSNLLNESYKTLKSHLKETNDKWDIYDLVRDLLSVSKHPFLYVINKNLLSKEVLHLAMLRMKELSPSLKKSSGFGNAISSFLFSIFALVTDLKPNARDVRDELEGLSQWLLTKKQPICMRSYNYV